MNTLPISFKNSLILKSLLKDTFNLVLKSKGSKFSTDTLWLVISQATLIVSGFFINTLIGYYLGTEDLGIYNQVLGFYLILTTIFSLGLNNTILKKVSAAHEEKEQSQLLVLNLTLTFITSSLLSLLTYQICQIYPQIFSAPEIAHYLSVTLISFPIFNLNKNFMSYFSAKRNQKMFSFLRSGRWFVLILTTYLFIGLECGLSEIMYSFLIAELVLLITSVLVVNKELFVALKFSKTQLSENFNFGLKSFASELFAVFNDKFDILIIGYFLSKSDVGIYSFFIFFVKSLYIFPGILQQNINPIISKFWESAAISELQIKLNSLRKINSVVVIFQAFAIIFAYIVMTQFLKQEFDHSLTYLLIALIGILPSAMISWSGSILIMTGKLKENIQRTFLIMSFSLVTTLFFSYYFELMGASIAICINSLFSFYIMNSFVSRILGLKLI